MVIAGPGRGPEKPVLWPTLQAGLQEAESALQVRLPTQILA